MMRRSGRKRGFTLFELLVVIMLMGVAATLGGTILNEVMDGWRRVSVRAELDAMAELVFERMGKDFADVLSADLSGVSLVGISETLEGSPRYSARALSNDTVIIPIRTSTGPHRPLAGATVMYRVERENGRSKLVQTVGDLLTDIPIGGRVETIPGADVIAMRIEYASKDGGWVHPNESEGWFEAGLPRAVRVSLVLADRDHSYEQVARSKVFPIHVD